PQHAYTTLSLHDALPICYRYAPDDGFDRAAGWLYDGMSKAFAANTARLAIVGDNPMLLAGENPIKVARASKANSVAYQPALEKIDRKSTRLNSSHSQISY